MEKMKRIPGKLVTCIAEIIIGILLLINPIGFTKGILIALGIGLIIVGAVNVVKYFKESPEEAANEKALASGLLLLLVGFFFALRTDWFIVTFPLLTVFYGIMNLVTGVSKIQWAVDMVRMKQKYWYIALIGALLTLLFAILILMNPFATTSVLWTFTGVTLIVEAIIDILTFITNVLPFKQNK
ncbi:MAG: DUF308 domain-containing protein [Lachnospiraceae bacterium]|nr:DUF308 domain-containing protein [Lachnospiraceae bacterium]